MILEIKEERKIEQCSKYFVNWTKSEFEELARLTKKARVKKDGTFYKRDKEVINNRTVIHYRALLGRFELDKAMIEDEKATVLRMLDTLPAEKFRYFAEITFEPYINLETDTTIIYEG